MSSNTADPEIVRVSQKGQATIPKALREKFGIDTPGEVFIYEEAGRIVVTPVPTVEELHGIHAGEDEPGEVLERVRELRDLDEAQEAAEAARAIDRPGADGNA